jgi:hypothetical protein
VLWNHRVHAGREVTANRPYIIIKNKKRLNMHAGRCADGNVTQNDAEKENK